VKSQGQEPRGRRSPRSWRGVGIPRPKSRVEEGDTDTAPYGWGSASRRKSSGRSPRRCVEEVRDKARKIAATTRGCREDLEWERWHKVTVKARRNTSKRSGDRVAAYTNIPEGWRPDSRACTTTTRRHGPIHSANVPPSWRWKRARARSRLRRHVAVEECGVTSTRDRSRVDPRRPHRGFGSALMELLTSRTAGRPRPSTSWTTGCPPLGVAGVRARRGHDHAVAHHPLGANGGASRRPSGRLAAGT